MARFNVKETVWFQRNEMVHKIVSAAVDGFVRDKDEGEGFEERRCLATGRLFVPRHRWHFFYDADARKLFYSGQIRPRHPN